MLRSAKTTSSCDRRVCDHQVHFCSVENAHQGSRKLPSHSGHSSRGSRLIQLQNVILLWNITDADDSIKSKTEPPR